MLTLIFSVLFTWNLTQTLIHWLLVGYSASIITYAVSYLVNYAIIYFAAEYMVPSGTYIRRRYSWMVFDFFQVAIQMVTGLTTAILRLILAIVVLLLALPRMDRSLCPAWFDDLLPLDSVALSYDAVVLIYHRENCPVAIVFVRLLKESSKQRAASQSHGSPSLVSGSTKLRVANRWRKAYTLIRNPRLIPSIPSAGLPLGRASPGSSRKADGLVATDDADTGVGAVAGKPQRPSRTSKHDPSSSVEMTRAMRAISEHV